MCPTVFVYPISELETVIDSSGIPPLMRPRSPIGRQSIVGAKPDLHLQVNAPGVFMHSVDARSHWLVVHSFISAETDERIQGNRSFLVIIKNLSYEIYLRKLAHYQIVDKDRIV